MSRQLLLILLLALSIAVVFAFLPDHNARAASLCVNPGGTGGCYANIQSAVDAAHSGDTILIASGVYTTPSSHPCGNSPEICIETDNLTIQGSGLSTIVTPTLRNFGYNTVISNLMSQDAPFVGIRNEGDLTLRNVVVTGNNTWGIYILGGTLDASNVSLYTSIGLVCNYYAKASITNSVITTLTSYHPVYCSSITLTNITIIGKAFYASPIITATNTIFNQGCSAPIHSLGHNIDVGNTCGLNATGDMTITNPMLTPPIMVNGMLVNALQPGSPAIDKGDDATCPITDATGFPRPYGTHCDIGAYEWRPMSFYFYFFPFIAR